jgi:predicted ATPase/DNA-binding winged helix-turn-helix (wHTH) protein
VAVLLQKVSMRGGDVVVDLAARTLSVGGRPAKLGGRAFDVLHALLERHDRVVTKQELLDLVWPGMVVEENNLQVHVGNLRRLLGADAIATVAGRGYRLTLRPDEIVTSGPRVRSADVTAPAPAARLFGRDPLLAQARDLLRDPQVRLLTLIGPGGAGKTRLAQHLTADVAGAFADGAYTVLLAPLRDAALVASAIASVLGVQEVGGQPTLDLIVGRLRQREVLLALDNFEHLMSATSLVEALLQACPRLKVVITSRAPLRLPGEQRLAVPPLQVPARHAAPADLRAAPALQLMYARAAAAGAAVGDGAGELAAMAEICRALDGLPLAIELAATRLRLMPPGALLKRLGSRLQLLAAGGDGDERQRTLRATIAWSHELLSEPQRRLFRRLAAFSGSFSLDAAEALADSADRGAVTLDALAALVDHSLVQRTEDVDGEPRFIMLETVREFALGELQAGDEERRVRARHADRMLDAAEAAAPRLTGVERSGSLQRLTVDLQNLRLALQWYVEVERDRDKALRLAGALPWFWYFAGLFAEGRRWLDAALALDGGDAEPAVPAHALSGVARLAFYSADIAGAVEAAERSAALFRDSDDRRGLAFALFHLGVPLFFTRALPQSRAALGESRRIFKELGDPWGVALATVYEGSVLAFLPGHEDEARVLLMEGQARFAALDDPWGETVAPAYLALLALRAGRLAEAERATVALIEPMLELGDHYRLARGYHQLAEILQMKGEVAQARARLLQSMTINREQLRWGDLGQQLRTLARLEWSLERAPHAVRLMAAGRRPDLPRAVLPPDDPLANDAMLADARAALGDAFDAEHALGSVLSVEQATDWALARSPRPSA